MDSLMFWKSKPAQPANDWEMVGLNSGTSQQPPEKDASAISDFMSRRCPMIHSLLTIDLQLSYPQRIAGALLSLVFGCFMLFAAFTSLWTINLTRFGTCFAFANVGIMLSSCCLVGPYSQLANMFTPARRVAASAYLGTLVLTLWVTFAYPHWYLIAPLTAVQFASLLWYVAGYFPGLPSFGPLSWFSRKSVLPI